MGGTPGDPVTMGGGRDGHPVILASGGSYMLMTGSTSDGLQRSDGPHKMSSDPDWGLARLHEVKDQRQSMESGTR